MTLAAALGEGIRALGLDIGLEAQRKLLAYIALLQKWNRTHNLTAIREAERMVSHHVLDSLAVLPHLPGATALRIVDIGSGGGLPGIPIAAARPHWRVTLLDSNHKKAAFLRQAGAELALRNIDVVARRAEDYDPDPLFDAAVSRAYSDLADFAKASRRLTHERATWMAMKGTYPEAEIAELPDSIRVVEIVPLHVPGLDAERHLVAMQSA